MRAEREKKDAEEKAAWEERKIKKKLDAEEAEKRYQEE